MGILLCGLNGAGKSTLGKALSEKLGFQFIDSEELFFPKINSQPDYTRPHKKEEARRLLLEEIKSRKNFVLASVTGDFGEDISSCFQYAVWVVVPKEIRMKRLRERSFSQFGDRMLPGGDLYGQEEAFFRFAGSRAENTVENWLRSLTCPVIKIDGTKPIEENVSFLGELITGKKRP
ncbi:MAG: AAA family ATPase [Acutalibacter sp.]|nr:AAA family ATPase [Acutalibacter sp.]